MMIVPERTILIIEDNIKTAASLARILEQAGYNPEILCTFEEANEYIRKLKENNCQNIVCAIFDYVLDSETLATSVPLVKRMKSIPNFKGILLANSSEHFANSLLLTAGCTHSRSSKDKIEASSYAIRLLKN